jgi:hypothetical protein
MLTDFLSSHNFVVSHSKKKTLNTACIRRYFIMYHFITTLMGASVVFTSSCDRHVAITKYIKLKSSVLRWPLTA